MREISYVVQDLLASQEALCSMELVNSYSSQTRQPTSASTLDDKLSVGVYKQHACDSFTNVSAAGTYIERFVS
jgi:hypothetical protein